MIGLIGLNNFKGDNLLFSSIFDSFEVIVFLDLLEGFFDNVKWCFSKRIWYILYTFMLNLANITIVCKNVHPSKISIKKI